MADEPRLTKVRHRLRTDGVLGTARAVADRLTTTAVEAIEGVPGYYRLRRRLLYRRHDAAAISPIRVSPDEIHYLTGEYERRGSGHLDYVPYFKPRDAGWDYLPYEEEVPYGAVRGGEWDRGRDEFSDLLLYRGTEQRFVEGLPWNETDYFAALVEHFRTEGYAADAARRLATARCDRVESVYETIEGTGYRSQAELNGHPLHEVTVTVDRDGRVRYNCEGRHRLAVAKVLGVEEIPVLVLVTHEEFEGELSDVGV